MNKTTKAKYDLATRMLKVDISIDEVALMSGLTIDEIEKLKAGIEPEEIIDEAAFAEKALKNNNRVNFYPDAFSMDDGFYSGTACA